MLLTPAGTNLEPQKATGIPQNKIALLKDAARQGRIGDLDVSALGFFGFVGFWVLFFFLIRPLET